MREQLGWYSAAQQGKTSTMCCYIHFTSTNADKELYPVCYEGALYAFLISFTRESYSFYVSSLAAQLVVPPSIREKRAHLGCDSLDYFY